MYCKKCGTIIDIQTNYCTSCGTPQYSAKKKHTILWIGLCIGVVVILLTLSVVVKILTTDVNKDTEKTANNSISTTTAANSEKEDISNTTADTFNTNTYEYGDTVILSGEIPAVIDLKDYLPQAGTYYKDSVYSTEIITLVGNEVLGYQDNLVNYSRYMGTYPDNSTMALAGTYSTQLVQRTDDMNGGIMRVLLQQVLENPNGTPYQTVIATEPNTEFHSSDVSILYAPNNFYTVSIDAGTFENCICSIREYQNGTDENIDVSYYAPGIGCILMISGGTPIETFYHTEWVITEELVKIDSLTKNDTTISETANSNTIQLPENCDPTFPQVTVHLDNIPPQYAELFLEDNLEMIKQGAIILAEEYAKEYQCSMWVDEINTEGEVSYATGTFTTPDCREFLFWLEITNGSIDTLRVEIIDADYNTLWDNTHN